mgnify:CR=1 FL=1
MIKYMLVFLFFFITVAAGVSVVLSEFNRMVYPAGPAEVFRMDCEDSGGCRIEFLGEKIVLYPPAGMAGFNQNISFEIQQSGGQALEKMFVEINNFITNRITGTNFFLSGLLNRFSVTERSLPGGAGEH